MSRIRVEKDQKVCPYCKGSVDPDQPHMVCRACLTRHHRDCWQEHGSCAVFGCPSSEALVPEGSVVPVRRGQPPSRPSSPPPSRSSSTVPSRQSSGGRGGILALAVVALMGVGGAVFYFTMAKGPKSWDGKKNLYCRKGEHYLIRDLTLNRGKRILTYNNCRLELRNVTLTSSSGLYISGTSQVTIVNSKLITRGVSLSAYHRSKVIITNSELYGSTGLTANGSSRVSVDGGRIEGSGYAIRLGGNAILRVNAKVKIKGKIYRSPRAKIFGIPEEEAKLKEQLQLKKYASGACSGMLACHKKHRQFGQLRLRVYGNVETNGTISSARYSGNGSPQVQRCIEETMRNKRISGYDGKQRGMLECAISGTYLESGVQMISTSERFRRRR